MQKSCRFTGINCQISHVLNGVSKAVVAHAADFFIVSSIMHFRPRCAVHGYPSVFIATLNSNDVQS